MRLLRTTSRDPELVYYADEQGIPPYAILSHTWEEEEVTFQYIHDLSTAKNMKGYSKIMRACELARSDDYKYIWIDTCCIDKSSSAELSEAINSMYGYYREAEVCYAYLADVQSNLPRQLFETAFCECKWFTRGWTLQELLAPMTVIFFARDWKEIGTKASLQGIITNITGIPPQVLLMNGAGEISIAKRMSWGAGRKTTRIEDKAYSLMGIFGVFMPTIYGEGPNAFTRLQEEILKVSDDQTIFAWKANTQSVVSGGLLATSPDDFGESGGYERFDRPDTRRPYSMTNLGLQIRLPLIPRNRHDEFLALLNCRQQGTLEYLAIYVKRSHVSDGHQFARMHPNVLVPCREKGSPQELFFKERDPARFEVGEWVRCSSQYQISFFFPGEVILQQKYSPTPASWTDHDTDKNIVYLHFPGSGSSGALLFRDNQFNQPFIVMAGVHNYNIWLDIVLDFDKNKPIDLEDVQGSYYRDNGRGGMLWKNLDRTSKHLTNNKAILVEARRKGTNNRGDPPYHMVNIRIVDRMHPDVPPAILLTRAFEYVFDVSFSNATNVGFSLLEAYPDNFWEVSGNNTESLFLTGSGTSGILLFRHQRTGEKFAVMLGIHNYALWSDILTNTNCNFDRESAKNIRDSYYLDNGGRGEKLWEFLRSTSRPLSNLGLTVLVASHETGKLRNRYQSDISVAKR